MSWTEDRVRILRILWLEGLTATNIARQLGGVTRSAVIGKAHRLGISRPEPSRPGTPLSKPKASKEPRVTKPAASSAKPQRRRDDRPAPDRREVTTVRTPCPTPEERGLATVLTLNLHTCRWPIGDPSTDTFSFCGRGTGGQTYCTDHVRIAYAPAPKGYRRNLMRLARLDRRPPR